jgi:hypothetical protein
VVNAIQYADQKPMVGTAPINSISRFRVLNAYASFTTHNIELSFGNQSLWLSPDRGGSFIFGDNAEPIPMVRISQVSPRKLFFPFSFLGPVQTELFFGRLDGQHYVNTQDCSIAVQLGSDLPRQPYIHGFKISLKPTPNFEFGVAVTGVMGGPKYPITWSTFYNSFFSTVNSAGTTDPGDRRSSFDFRYRLPLPGRFITLYTDAMTEDEVSPLGFPRRSSWNPGVYFSKIPKLPNVDFQVEGGYTDLPGLIQPIGGGFFYWNVRYLDGYTNQGNLIGSWLGRQGVGMMFGSKYWMSPKKWVELTYRNGRVDKDFLEGGWYQDIGVKTEYWLNNSVALSGMTQYEWWKFPLLSPAVEYNFTASFQVTFRPKKKL